MGGGIGECECGLVGVWACVYVGGWMGLREGGNGREGVHMSVGALCNEVQRSALMGAVCCYE